MDAIAKVETGGNFKARGKSGEHGATQMLPSTWRQWSRDVLGYVAPFTETNERYVALRVINSWVAEGLTDRQIGYRWNSGRHTGCSKGVNKHGAEFDSCSYADKLLASL